MCKNISRHATTKKFKRIYGQKKREKERHDVLCCNHIILLIHYLFFCLPPSRPRWCCEVMHEIDNWNDRGKDSDGSRNLIDNYSSNSSYDLYL